MSDHNAIICVLNILPQYKRQPKRTIFMYNKANWDNVRTKKSISANYILIETLIFTQLKTIVCLFKHQLKT